MTVMGGFDIGGTKCAVSLSVRRKDNVFLLEKIAFPTAGGPEQTMESLCRKLETLMEKHQVTPASIGVSCGGPLNSKEGVILSPPNLPGWDQVPITAFLKKRYGVPVLLQNDANAGALAEWYWGAGRGSQHIIFLTFGTGMGAGLILNGRLYSGTNDLGGEVGHMRLAEDGPVGFGKAGSFEGFCSGGGIAGLARKMALEALEKGEKVGFCRSREDAAYITAKSTGEAAEAGDPLALKVYETVGIYLGRGLSILIDILNPEKIIIGSIYGRQQTILEPIVQKELAKESLPLARSVCEIVPAGLGEKIGDYASAAVAMLALEEGMVS
ncbi:ROK family protein [Alteribacillus sp. HJP-4]|uniref:ROK family protein n=1 Tax=Alteribacillus sp. HJP-4 TaxID=2775394 RepID=UPI0035CD0C16